MRSKMKKNKGTWKHLLGTLGIVFCTIMNGNPVIAQDVDYSGLEELFGETVTTSATGKPQTISNVPVSMDIITAEEIRRSGAIDIPQLLKRYAGMDVARNFVGNADVSIRGYNQPLSNRLLTLINGRQVYQDTFAMTMWQSLPIQLSEIKQIEIVRGPNTSLFGLNASAGVINIITYNPLRDDIDSVEGRIGTKSFHGASGVSTVKINDDFGIRVSMGDIGTDGFTRTGMNPVVSASGALKNQAINLDAQYNFSDRTSLRVEAGYNQATFDSSWIFYTNLRADNTVRHLKFTLSHDAGTWGVWDLNAYRNSSTIRNAREFFGDSVVVPTVKNELDTVELSSLFSPFVDHTFRISGEYRHNYVTGPALGAEQNAAMTMNIYSLAGMWDWQISDKWSWTNSVRGDIWRTDKDGTPSAVEPKFNLTNADLEPGAEEYSFNSGLVFQANPASSYRLNISRGVHIPSFAELSMDLATIRPALPLGVSEIYGNPHLKSESNFTVDFGYTRKLPEKDITLGSNLVYQKLRDVILPTAHALDVPTNLAPDFTYENVGDSDSILAEFSARGRLFDGALGWHLNYTYMLVDDNPDGLPDHLLDFEGTQPKHKVNLALDYTRGKWELDTDLHYVSDLDYRGFVGDILDVRFQEDVDSYIQINARIAYNFSGQTSLSIDGFNLFEDHNERPFIPVTPLPTGTSPHGGNNIGRIVFLTLRHGF